MKKIIDLIKTDLFIIFFLLIIAAIPRLILLDKIPPGIHGDEGWGGIVAREIISKGSIPAYIDAATGVPSAASYFTAFIFKMFGENIFLLRLSTSIIGIMTIIVLYIFFRLFFNKKVSLLTTVAFNFSLIHIHYSRVSYNVIYLPFIQLMSLIFIIKARKKNNLIFTILSAFFAGLGLHSYHPFILFPFTIVILLLIDIYKQKFPINKIKELLLFITVFIIISLPILKVIIYQPNFYFSHVKTYNILNEPQIQNQSNILNKFEFVLKAGFENISHFFLGNKVDFVDAFGKYYNFNKSYIVLFLLGTVLSFVKKKKFNFFIFCSLIFFLTPTFFTFEGTYRRSILTLIYFYYFVAVAINWILNIFKNKRHIILFLLITFIILLESYINLHTYFNFFPYDEETKYVFTYELTKVGLMINQLANIDTKILVYSSRWSCKYETLRFINNDRDCENRSKEFGNFSLDIKSNNNVLFVFLNNYINLFEDVKNRYPVGIEKYILDNNSNKVLGILYKI